MASNLHAVEPPPDLSPPRAPDVHVGLAEALSYKGQKDLAAEHYKQALEKVKDDDDPDLKEDEKASLAKRVEEKLRTMGRGTDR